MNLYGWHLIFDKFVKICTHKNNMNYGRLFRPIVKLRPRLCPKTTAPPTLHQTITWGRNRSGLQAQGKPTMGGV